MPEILVIGSGWDEKISSFKFSKATDVASPKGQHFRIIVSWLVHLSPDCAS